MQRHEFDTIRELELTSEDLATASVHKVFVDVGADLEADAPSNDFVHAGGRTGIWNERDERVSYISGSRYTVTQHREVIDVLVSALRSTTGTINHGYIRDWGEQIDGFIVFDDGFDLFDLIDDYSAPDGDPDTDEINLGLRFTNSIDGSSKVEAETFAYRFYCSNGMILDKHGLGESSQIHVEALDESLFADLVLELFDTKDEAQQLIIEADDDMCPIEWVPGILDHVGFGPRYITRLCERVESYAENGEVSRWAIYNSVTREIEHNTAESASMGVYDHYQDIAQDLLAAPLEEYEYEDEFSEIVA